MPIPLRPSAPLPVRFEQYPRRARDATAGHVLGAPRGCQRCNKRNAAPACLETAGRTANTEHFPCDSHFFNGRNLPFATHKAVPHKASNTAQRFPDDQRPGSQLHAIVVLFLGVPGHQAPPRPVATVLTMGTVDLGPDLGPYLHLVATGGPPATAARGVGTSHPCSSPLAFRRPRGRPGARAPQDSLRC